MTWEDCIKAGMTVGEAARARGRTKAAASKYAKAHGLLFSNSIPSTPPKVAAIRAARAEAMRARWACPETRAVMLSAQEKGWTGRRCRILLTDEERCSYNKILREGGDRDGALRAIGRSDLADALR